VACSWCRCKANRVHNSRFISPMGGARMRSVTARRRVDVPIPENQSSDCSSLIGRMCRVWMNRALSRLHNAIRRNCQQTELVIQLLDAGSNLIDLLLDCAQLPVDIVDQPMRSWRQCWWRRRLARRQHSSSAGYYQRCTRSCQDANTRTSKRLYPDLSTNEACKFAFFALMLKQRRLGAMR